MTGLLDLPPELRVMIYRMLFPKQDIHVIDGVAMHQSRSRLDPSIIRVSRQVAKEIPAILYSQTSFHIYAGHGSENWLCQINQANRDYLRIVTCHLQRKDSPSLVRSLKFLAQCSHISLIIKTTMWSPLWFNRFFSPSLFENLHGFADASITLHPARQKRCQEDYYMSFETIKRKLDDGVQRLLTPCPRYCGIHTGRERSQATASMHIVFPRLHSVDHASYTVSSTWMERSDPVFKPY